MAKRAWEQFIAEENFTEHLLPVAVLATTDKIRDGIVPAHIMAELAMGDFGHFREIFKSTAIHVVSALRVEEGDGVFHPDEARLVGVRIETMANVFVRLLEDHLRESGLLLI